MQFQLFKKCFETVLFQFYISRADSLRLFCVTHYVISNVMLYAFYDWNKENVKLTPFSS